MKFKSISLKNFFRFGNNEQIVDLSGTGETLISGPNGYGKSTIVEGIVWSLYGKTRQISVDDVVNRYTGKDCKVSLEFQEGKDNYKIIRYRKHTTHNNNIYLFKNNNDISCKNSSDTNQLIIDIIQMPYLAFVNSSVFSSELYTDFLGAKNSDRIVILENILSLKEINIFYAETKKILKELEDKNNDLKLKQEQSKTETNSISSNIISYNSQAKQKLLELKQEKEKALNNKKEAESKIIELNSININDEKSKISNSSIIEELDNQINKEQKNLSEYNNKISEYNNKISILNNFLSEFININFKEEIEKEEKWNKVKEQKNLKEQTLSSLKKELAEKNNTYYSLINEKNNYLKQTEVENSKLESIKDNICPTCHQSINKEEVEKQKKDCLKNIKEYEESLLEINEKIELNKKEIENSKDLESNLIEELDVLKRVVSNINFISNPKALEQEFKLKKENKEALSKDLEEYTKKSSEILNSIDLLKQKKSNIEVSIYSIEYINSIEEQIKNNQAIISNSDITIATINGSVKSIYNVKYIEELKEKLKLAEEKNFKDLKKLEENEDENKYYKYLSDCFSNKSEGFKKFFIGEMIDIFNEKINKFLPFFFNEEININFDKDLNSEIKMDGFSITFKSLSAGQKTRAELAVAFALFNVSRVFFSNDNSLLMVDEMFDKGLDQFGIKSAISVLNAFSNQSKIFIISHNPYIKELIENKIEISRDENGFSVIN